LFTEDGELRDVARENERQEAETRDAETRKREEETKNREAQAAKAPDAAPYPANSAVEHTPVTPFPGSDDADATLDTPPAPTAAEQKAQADAYRKSSDELNSRVELSGRSAKEFEMTFERFMASLYMTAMLQLGLMHQQGEQPRVDIIGARQTIDTLALLAEKTKGNLTPTEENFLQNSLYEVRMAYVEVTNALSRPPQPGVATGTGGR
jgi:hypothetical protein